MQRRARRLIAISLFLGPPGLFSLSCEAEEPPNCAWPYVAPGQLTVTPAQVTGTPFEHLPLHADYPASQADGQKKASSGAYLITGDKVDLVSSCNGYAYVRFHGKKRVSTGWVEGRRVQATGKPYIPLPPNAPMLCQAAADVLNKNHGTGSLKALPLSAVPSDALARLHIEPDFNAANPQVAYAEVDGRPIALVSMEAGGTCHTSSVTTATGDLKVLLAPNDASDRNPRNDGRDGWSFGVDEQLVEVLGQPMVMSTDLSAGSDFYLSEVDKNGDIVPTCLGKRVDAPPQIQASFDDRVCHDMLSANQTEIPMGAPASGERLVRSKKAGSSSDPADHRLSPTKLSLPGGQASTATLTLKSTGLVDVDNSGRPRRVGILTQADADSTAGCGNFSEHYAKPVYIDEHGVADPDAALNKPFDNFGEGKGDASFVKFDGKTYIKLLPAGQGPSEVWKFDAYGAHQMCVFQQQRYEVKPISGQDSSP